MQENRIDSLVAKVAEEVKGQSATGYTAPKPPVQNNFTQRPYLSNSYTRQPQTKATFGGFKKRYTIADYPLLEKHPEIVVAPTGKPLSAITLDAVKAGDVTPEDVRISPEMLLNQADIAESAGKRQIADNLRRAAEMIAIEDDVVIQMYDMLRPNRATKQQLLDLAETLKTKYQANRLAQLVTEACAVYEKRGILLKG